MSNPINRIAGKTVTGSVGEPWDFHSADGNNCFFGKVLSVEHNHNGEQVLLCLISSFQHLDRVVKTVVASPRYKSKIGISGELLEGNRLDCNFLFQTSGDDINVGEVKTFLSLNPKPNFLIGSLKLQTTRGDAS
jgi:hypothetical protein